MNKERTELNKELKVILYKRRISRDELHTTFCSKSRKTLDLCGVVEYHILVFYVHRSSQKGILFEDCYILVWSAI